MYKRGMVQASCVQYRLVIRDVSTLQILPLYTCLDQIQHVARSSDSMFIRHVQEGNGTEELDCGLEPGRQEAVAEETHINVLFTEKNY
ncbi:WD repeat-containing protein WRAP73-like [Aquarana catesbeiana]|uniref:WD repeat-containing protein WRAP73-like n=1 Tax=Aquarana catesbeiana TaxID=8400 RepID=UPI003CCA3FEA